MFLSTLPLLPLILSIAHASPLNQVGKRCTGNIQSLNDVAAAQQCTTINIGGFTVPAGQTFALSVPNGTVINLTGSLSFAVTPWAGPLMQITGNSVTFNGNGHQIVGNGDQYWDGQGIDAGIQKPDPMFRVEFTGTLENVKIVNSPGRAIAIEKSVTVTGVTVDNSAGDAANSRSGGKPAGANTDGFDVSANNVVIQNSVVKNQDDCLAINKGTGITFSSNTCSGGHGISVGSISSDVTVSGVTISSNTVTNSVNGLRIKTKAASTDSTVSNIVYSNNKISSISKFGVLIDQSYPSTLGTPGTGVVISGVSFTGSNSISVNSGAQRVAINCGSTSSCPGTWNFSGLTATGGSAGTIKNAKVSGGSF